MNSHFVSRSTCPACGSHGVHTVFSRPYADPRLRTALERFYAEVGQLDYDALLGADYVIQCCGGCSLVFQRDVPDDYLLGRLYEEWISPERAFARFHVAMPPTRYLEIARNVAVSLALVGDAGSPLRALDYGCGWGEWGRMTKAFGAATWGTELSAARRDSCQRAGITIMAENDLPDASFDFINADQVFEHLPAPAATLALLAAKLRPRGVIRIAVPNGWRARRSLAGFDRELERARLGGLNAIAPLEHLNCFTTHSLVRMAAPCGLARIVPRRSIVWQSLVWPASLRGKLKQLVRPFYLRSRWSTELWFENTGSAVSPA